MRVLITGADETFLEILQSYLWDRGHETEIATTGLECMAIVREFVPEVLVLGDELLWGGCDGVLALMGESFALVPKSVILISENRHYRSLPLGLRWSIVKILHKPFRLGDLTACIDDANRTTKSGRAPYHWTAGAHH